MKATYQRQNIITQLIENCNEEYNIDKRMEILYHINSILAKQHKNTISGQYLTPSSSAAAWSTPKNGNIICSIVGP
jgi:hypothetical protein